MRRRPRAEAFAPTRQALARIAKEGRKYGISLALITQRPSELDATILSQCSTAIVLRLSNERDLQAMRSSAHEGVPDMLEFVPLLGDREAILLGQGVSMPMRIIFDDLDDGSRAAQSQRGIFEDVEVAEHESRRARRYRGALAAEWPRESSGRLIAPVAALSASFHSRLAIR